MGVNDPHKRNVGVDAPPSVGCHAVILPGVRIHCRLDRQPGVSLSVQAGVVLVPLQHAVIGWALDGDTQGELVPVHDLLRLRLTGYGWFSCGGNKQVVANPTANNESTDSGQSSSPFQL